MTTADQFFEALMDAVVLQGGMCFRAVALGIQPQNQDALMWLQASDVWRRQETKMHEFIQDSKPREAGELECPFLLSTSTVKGQPELVRAKVKEDFDEAEAQYDSSSITDDEDAKKVIVLPDRAIAYFAPNFFGEHPDITLYAGIFGTSSDDNEIAMKLFVDMLGSSRENETGESMGEFYGRI